MLQNLCRAMVDPDRRFPGCHAAGLPVSNRLARTRVVLRWVHRIFANLKIWALGVYHGLRKAHLPRYRDEFVFRWNRRRYTRAALDRLLGIGA